MNPIQGKELYNDDGTLKKLLEELNSVNDSYSDLLKKIGDNAAKIEVRIKKLTGAQVEQREEIKKAASETSALQKAQAKLNTSQSNTAKQIATIRRATAEQNKVNKLNAQLAASAAGSYNQLAAQYALNKIELNKLSTEQRKATKEGRELEQNSKAIFEEMKRLQEATGKHVLSVGDYEKGTRKLLVELQQMPGALGSSSAGIDALDKGFRAILANPIVALIAALIAGLAALGKAWFRSVDGAEAQAKITGTINAGLSLLTRIATDLADKIQMAFNDPIGTLEQFGQTFVREVLDRFRALPAFVGAVGRAIQNLIKGDLAGVREAGLDAGIALQQAFTGQTKEDLEAFGESMRQVTQEVRDQVNAFVALEQARRAVAIRNNELARSIEQVVTQEQLLSATANDSTISFQEQQDALQEASRLNERRARLEIELAKNNLSLISQEIALRRRNGEDTLALLDQQTQAIREVIAAEREFSLTVRDNEQLRRQIRQDELERNLDILIDLSDNQKTVNERLLKDERLTFAERRKIRDQTDQELEDAFLAQIATVQQFTDVTLDANDLIQTSDAIALNSKIRALGLSEIIEGRLIEIIRDRRLAVQDLAEAEVELNEREAKANAASLKAEAQKLELQKQQQLEEFNQLQALEKSKFDLVKDNAAERAKFELEQEREKLKKILELNEKFQGNLSALQIQTIQNQIARLDQDIAGTTDNEPVSIYDRLGLSVSEEQQKTLSAAFGQAKAQLIDFFNTRIRLAQQDVEQSNNALAAAQRNLETELQDQRDGQAARVELARQEVAEAEANQRKALKNQERAQKEQIVIDTLSQASNVTTAVSKVLSQFGFPLGPIFAGTIIGSFLLSKAKAFAAAKKQFRDGGLEIIGGGSHASGNDTYLGFNSGGKPAYAERDEAHAIINKKSTAKYRHILPEVVNSLNKGNFEDKFMAGMGVTYNSINTNVMENHLSAIRKQGERQITQDGNGNTVEYYKNFKITRINAT